MNDKRYLLHVYQILDIEYDALGMIAAELREKGKSYAADDIGQAQESLLKAILQVKKSWKFLDDGKSLYEQLKMNL